MSTALPMITETEIARVEAPDRDAGFGALKTERGVLPLKAMSVDTRIAGLIAEMRLRQTFVNALSEPLEAVYVFPLPDRAAVRDFRLEVAGRVIVGEIKERGAAREEYQAAIQAGHRAAITEEERPDVFTIQVGNLMPGETAVVDLTLTGPLVYDDGEVTFHFPLVVAPRYIPGTPLPGDQAGDGMAPDTDAVPDASRISPPVLLPGFPNPIQLSLAVEVDGAGFALSNVRSSLHALVEEERGDAFCKVRVKPGERLNRDFILRFRLAGGAVRTGLVLVGDDQGEGGTYQLTLLPPAESAGALRPRDVVFVLDRSGSMGGWKMVAARRAMARMIDTLTERDRFAVYAFDDRIETVPNLGGLGLGSATDRNRYRAVEFLARIEARGGTEMAGPLNSAADQLSGYQDRDRILVLVTDGQVGNEDQILRTLAPRLKGSRIFALGIDRAVNAGFLRRLAVTGGGACELVESEDRLDEVMAKVHRRLAAPVLREVSVEADGIELVPDTRVPDRLADLFPGAPLTVLGRFKGKPKPNCRLRVRATDAAGGAWIVEVKGQPAPIAAIPAVWARAIIRQLEDEYATGTGKRSALEKQIIDTSLTWRVLSRFTAFVAVDRSEVVNKGGKGRRLVQPVDSPEGWDMLDGAGSMASIPGYGGAVPAGMPAPMAPMAMAPPPSRARLSEVQPSIMPGASGGGFFEDLKSAIAGPFQRKAKVSEASKKAPAGSAKTMAIDPSAFDLETRREAPPQDDLSAYRERARRLLDALDAEAGGDGAARRRALGTLGVALRELLEDLASIGATHGATEPLEELARELASGPGSDSALAALWTRAVQVLQAFIGSTGATPPKSRRAFWK